MKEYKKEIEIIINTIRGILQKDVKPTDEDVYSIDGRQFLAIEELLKRVEELEFKCKQKNKTIDAIRFVEAINRGQENIVLFDEEKCAIKNKYMLEVTNGEFIDANELYMIWKNSIPVSLVEEKIEEYENNMKLYENETHNIFNENNIRQEVITVLQELLEKRK